ncbi:type 4a pilus biogenesis protein PilO [Patescibacteria group bacterium]|nr:type 4a pilus biogenesis protein PilO [Patescibacteria group bacterium]MBU0776755.1 type 4a pilus biogenesis protein PilO [Patescibacteria group bacterium]MBU0846328.1 type 4a pilus biogenesis protein PilO [Patescibacteria group bacterium]MBU1066763.1 type 4a pilus biogenesis protein PilO [Patescibacteria group bacterium]
MALGWRKDYLRYRSYFLNIVNIYKQRQDLKSFLELILTLVTISFFALFALKPTLLTIIELLKEIETKEETVDKMNTKIQNLQQAQTLYIQEGARIKLLETAIPDNPAPDLFVRQVEGLATSYPVNLLGITIGEITLLGDEKEKRSKDELQPLPEESKGITFSISIAGSYQGVVNFLSALEDMRRPVKIDALNIISPQLEETQNLVLVVTGRTPYLKENSNTEEK